MSKYKFIKEPDPTNEFDKSIITIEFEAVDLNDICDEFQYFLRACSFAGDITIEHGKEEK